MSEMEKGKKEKQENKKVKNQEKSKPGKKLVENNNSLKQKKPKKNKSNDGEKPVKKDYEKENSSSFLWFILVQIIIVSVAIGFLYIVDYERFTKVKLAANASFNKTLSLLPPEVVSKGRSAFEVIRPFIEIIVSKLTAVVSVVSAFLNKNPVAKDHWNFVRDVSSVCGAIFAEYLRTVYVVTCRCLSKLLPYGSPGN